MKNPVLSLQARQVQTHYNGASMKYRKKTFWTMDPKTGTETDNGIEDENDIINNC